MNNLITELIRIVEEYINPPITSPLHNLLIKIKNEIPNNNYIKYLENVNKVKTKLNIMFDLHGVLQNSPNIFRPLTKTLRLAGHSVYVCSGPCYTDVLNELGLYGYVHYTHFDDIFSVTDFLISKGIKFTYDEKGNPWTDDKIWWASKSEICKIHNINLMIDDHIEYSYTLDPSVLFLLIPKNEKSDNAV